jgi:hypothetical protein
MCKIPRGNPSASSSAAGGAISDLTPMFNMNTSSSSSALSVSTARWREIYITKEIYVRSLHYAATQGHHLSLHSTFPFVSIPINHLTTIQQKYSFLNVCILSTLFGCAEKSAAVTRRRAMRCRNMVEVVFTINTFPPRTLYCR